MSIGVFWDESTTGNRIAEKIICQEASCRTIVDVIIG